MNLEQLFENDCNLPPLAPLPGGSKLAGILAPPPSGARLQDVAEK